VVAPPLLYLAGYSVECRLKALILSSVPDRARARMLESFKGNRAHDFQWLRATCFKHGGPRLPREIAHCFIIVGSWSTALRYQARMTKRTVAEEFLSTAETMIRWAGEWM